MVKFNDALSQRSIVEITGRLLMNRALVGLALVAVAAGVYAAPFQNGSFEVPPTAGTNVFNVPVGSTLITGWTVIQGNIDLETNPPNGWQPSNGTNSLDLVGTQGIGGITQTFDTVPGTTYQVAFDLAGNYGAPPVIKPLAVTINGVTTNFTFDTTGKSALNMGWTTKTVTFTASSTSSTISFVSDVTAAGGTLNAGAALDNVQITALGGGTTATIPLTWAHWAATLGLALVALFVLRRRKFTR